MTVDEIKSAVLAGVTVHWSNRGYIVTHDSYGQFHIVYAHTGDAIGLTWLDGVTLNGDEDQFFVQP